MNLRVAMALLFACTEVLRAAEAPRIEIFTTARTPIATGSIASVQIYNLDKATRIEAHLRERTAT